MRSAVVPGAVTAAQVMLAISATANFFWIIILAAALSLMSSLSSSAVFSGADAELSAQARNAQGLTVLGLLVAVAAVIVYLWGAIAVRRGSRTARTTLTFTAVVGTFLGLVVMSGTSSLAYGLLATAFGLPWTCTILGLLWLPETSRAWFGDTGPPRLTA